MIFRHKFYFIFGKSFSKSLWYQLDNPTTPGQPPLATETCHGCLK